MAINLTKLESAALWVFGYLPMFAVTILLVFGFGPLLNWKDPLAWGFFAAYVGSWAILLNRRRRAHRDVNASLSHGQK